MSLAKIMMKAELFGGPRDGKVLHLASTEIKIEFPDGDQYQRRAPYYRLLGYCILEGIPAPFDYLGRK